MRTIASLTAISVLLVRPALLFSEDVPGVRPLVASEQSVLPSDTHLLVEAERIEQFLHSIDGTPPDWPSVYGDGHHDAGLGDRLFNLNRVRDAKREGKPALQWRVTFLWSGELSDYDRKAGGFRVAVGPKVTLTRWGSVRFKPEGLPANLRAVPDATRRELLRCIIEQGEHVEVDVVVTGRLVPEESVVYDFSHDGDGLGVIMPVVRIEQIDFVLVQSVRDGEIEGAGPRAKID